MKYKRKAGDVFFDFCSTQTYRAFQRKFGTFGELMGRGFVYQLGNETEDCYHLPEMSDDELIELISQSVQEGKDLVLDVSKQNRCKPYTKGCLY